MAVVDDIQPGDGGVGYSWFAIEVVSYPVYTELPGEGITAIFKLNEAQTIVLRTHTARSGIVKRDRAKGDLRKTHLVDHEIIKDWDATTDIERPE